MPLDTFFTRRSRRLLRSAVTRPRFAVDRLEDRVVPAIMGTVYQDYNSNGIYEPAGGTLNNNGQGTIGTAQEIPLANVSVTATAADGTVVGPVLTQPDGTYSLPTAANTAYRIQFTPLAGFVPGPTGTNNGTTVQFASDGAIGVSLGLVRGSEAFPSNPLILTSQYQAGDGGINPTWLGGNFILQSAINPAAAGILGFPYTAGISDQLTVGGAVGQPPTTTGGGSTNPNPGLAVAIRTDNVGTTWGLGVDSTRQTGFAASFTKRHAGWGPGGGAAGTTVAGAGSPGTIYRFDIPDAGEPQVNTAAPWFSLPTTSVLQGAFANYRSGYTSQANYETDGDNLGWDAVGKTSFGGLDVNEAGTQVYVMNLADRQLYVIPINADGSAGTASAFPVPTPTGVPAGDMRPFAVQYYRGLVYVGLVNSAQSTQNAADLRAFVYTFDPATNDYSDRSVLNESAAVEGVSLNYSRQSSNPGPTPDAFRPWIATVSGVSVPDISIKYPQPMLTGIAFDAAGNMSLGIRDRTGDATGRFLPSDPANPGLLLEGYGIGDLLKAFGSTAGGWALEANAANPNNAGQVGQGAGNGQGPVNAGGTGGEFYAQDGLSTLGGAGNTNGTTDVTHRDVSLGGIAQIAGFPSVMTTVFDPQRGDINAAAGSVEFRTAGVRWFNSGTGLLEKSYRIYTTDQGGMQAGGRSPGGTFGKANGLGDLVGAPAAPPVEIGNRVFRDTDEDGIQDAGEPVLAGVTVELRSADGQNLLATGTTDGNGLYYFRAGATAGSVGNVTIVPGLFRGQAYQIRIPNALRPSAQQTPLDGLRLTQANAGGAGGKGINSAGTPGNGTAAPVTAAVVTADLTGTAAGESVHTFDFGFVPAPPLALGDFVWIDADNDGTFDANEQGLDAVPVSLFLVDAQGNVGTTAIQTTATAGGGKYLFTNLAPGQYVVQIAPGAGYRSSSGSRLSPTGPFEPVTGNADVNNQDHGQAVSGDLAAGFVIRANPVTLFEPGTGQNKGTFQVGGATVEGNPFQDFGIYKAFSLGNRVWLDKNNSGTIDAADGGTPGIDGVSVRLYSPAALNADGTVNTAVAPLLTTTTAGGGYYRFDSLLGAPAVADPADQFLGQYVVVIDGASAALANLRSSTGAVGLMGPFEPAANAIPAPSAPGVRLDSQDTGTTVTGTLVRGPVYTLGPAANTPTNETDSGPGDPGSPNAQSDLTADFGFFQPLSLGNLVFQDAANDGLFTPGIDTGIDGVTVQLFRADINGNPIGGAVDTKTTAGGGLYLFTGLTADRYVVRIDGTTLPAGFWRSSTGTNGSRTGPFEPGTDPVTDPRDSTDRGTTLQQDAGGFVIGTAPLNLTADNLTFDFGVFRPVSLGNFVFNDPNNNGAFDAATEAGVANVPVRLYADTNTNGVYDAGVDQLVLTTSTSPQGFYLFTELNAGGYFVEITPPAGFVSSTPVSTDLTAAGDNKNHGTLSGTVARSGLVTLAPGALDPAGFPATPGLADSVPNGSKTYAVDFGILQTFSLGDTVWNDLDNDGTFDRGTEVGLGNVPVELLDATGTTVLQTTATAADGTYLFTGLVPGQFQIRVTPPAGFISSTGTNGSPGGPFEPGVTDTSNDTDHGTQKGAVVLLQSPVTLLPGGQNVDNAGFANLRQDFGLFRPMSLGNFVWEDANNNGAFDAGETPLEAVTVTLLDGTGATVGTATTDAAGGYLFTNLIGGTYTIRVTTPAGFVSSTGTNGSASGPFEPGVSNNTNNVDHGTQPGLTGPTTSSVTLAAPGDTANNPDDSGFANLRQDFGFFRPLSLGDFVWNDANNSGAFDAGETPIGGVTVTLLDSTGATVGTTTTASTGLYNFSNLVPGTYTVRITPPAGFVSSTGKNGSLTSGPYEPGKSGFENSEDHGTTAGAFVTSTVTLAAAGSPSNPDAGGLANLRQDFGLFVPVRLGQIVFNDPNNNGIQDAGDTGVPGVTVTLLDSNGSGVVVTTTDAAGKYQFTGLTPGTYSVQIVPPAGVIASTPVFGPLVAADKNTGTQAGTLITSGAGTLVVGQGPAVGGNTDTNFFPTFNFGLVPVPVAQVSGFTYLDVNRNFVYEPNGGDRPIPNVTVTLTGNGITRTTTSDGTGFYQFTNLPPGSYTITETQPGGILYQWSDNVGNLGGTNPQENVLTVTLAGGDNGLRYNFGEALPGFLNGYVWVDRNRNCVFDAGEIVVGNVPITITGTAFAGTSRARPLAASDLPGGSLTVLTDAGGFYSFPVLPPGTYSVSRGGLPAAAAAIYQDWCLQIGDPSGNRPAVSGNQFGGVEVLPAGRGPLNFGLISATGGDEQNQGNDPTKRNFLGSTNPTVPPPTEIPAPGGPTRPALPLNPSFATTTTTPAIPALVVTASGPGTAPQVRVFDYAAGFERFRLTPYEETFTGGVRTATGDVDGDGTPDILTVTGPGGGPRVRAFSGRDGTLLRDFFAFESTFRGGAFIAAGDITGDGRAEIIVGAEQGGGPRVIVFDGATSTAIGSFFAFDAGQRGGVRVAAGDFDGDGRADIVTTTGTGVPTRVRTFSGRDLAAGTQTVLSDFAPYESTFTGGVNLAVGDYNGDGRLDIVVGAEAGGGPRVQVFDGKTQGTLTSFFAFESTATGGVRVAARDVTGDGRADLVVTPGTGGAARVRVLRAGDLSPIDDFFAFTPEFTGGAFVG